jgi:hypothetical protein
LTFSYQSGLQTKSGSRFHLPWYLNLHKQCKNSSSDTIPHIPWGQCSCQTRKKMCLAAYWQYTWESHLYHYNSVESSGYSHLTNLKNSNLPETWAWIHPSTHIEDF